MQYLSLNANELSGELPHEIGYLTELLVLHLSSSGISRRIPSSYAYLTELKTLWASDNNLTGSIPYFVGNWFKLTDLRLQGNSFAGPIPSTFSKKTALEEVRVSDISNGISTLEFLDDMRNLRTFLTACRILRNNDIHGTITPSVSSNEKFEHIYQLMKASATNSLRQIKDAKTYILSFPTRISSF
ncbi:probable LRR receptor-like serine/threonine-protein kinase At1g56140 [Rhodamnia argentea]|uniref:Probable LRR receptor-like serine/threonine-protein kinase At1g56140 n=1 Tax=Rhodamnia argentea TaxID=178133 RepID=A0ABM3HKQ3_9MYRT|nr:probable LRR receptor-like serine/threonine-protein kinase At1g56140 [Rhodamnia argentea]